MPDATTALFYQPDCGISGDMHIAAMLDLGVDASVAATRAQTTTHNRRIYARYLRQLRKMGISGTQVRVHAKDQSDHRHHATIINMIKEAALAPNVERRALEIFNRIAQAEAKIHGIHPDKVHFHEVGAVDSIVDVVAAALCIEALNVDVLISSAVEVGAGYVDCAHGRFPVPAPATQEILQGIPCTYGGVTGEATTPTGAAILSANVTEFSPRGSFAPERIGYGIGHKDFERPNVLRIALGQYSAISPLQSEHYKIEANIDDMAPEGYEPLMESLFAAGADDVYLVPIAMKKNRPAQCLTVLCDTTHKDPLTDLILNSSSTIGLRIAPFMKRVLPRETLVVQTSLGDVRVKLVTQPDRSHALEA